MKKWILRVLYAALVLFPIGAIADYTATQGSGSTIFAFVCSTTKICPAFVLIDSSNVEKATAGNPLRVDPVGTTTQPVSAVSWPLPTGAATQATLATLVTNLGSPFQAGGSIGNTSFGATQGNAGSNAQGWWTRIGDATNGPAAVQTAGADGVSNTASGLQVYSRGSVWNGSGWDRAAGSTFGSYQVIRDAAGNARGANVNASNQLAVAGPVTVVSGGIASGAIASGAVASGAVSSGAYAAGALAAGAFASGAGVDGWDLTQGTSTQTACAAPTSATACSVISILKGVLDAANTAGQLKVSSTGGATPTGNIAANNTTAVVVKASAGTLYGVQLAGIGSAPAYLKIYNATSATCGSGTPVKRLMIPAASTAANGAGSNITFGPMGVAFGTGITYCVTTGIGDADTTAPAASTFLVNLDWN